MNENVYIYQAEVYCEACGEAIRQSLTAEGKAPANPADERSYDSDEFPKGPYDNGGGEADSYHHCAHCHKFIGNPLTTDGVRYTIDALREYNRTGHGNTEALDEWAEDLADYCLDHDQKAVLEQYEEKRKGELTN